MTRIMERVLNDLFDVVLVLWSHADAADAKQSYNVRMNDAREH